MDITTGLADQPQGALACLLTSLQGGDGLMVVDMAGRVCACNELVAQLCGVTVGEAVGMRCWQMVRGRNSKGLRLCGPACLVRGTVDRGPPPAFQMWVPGGKGRRCSESSVMVATLVVGTERRYFIHVFSTRRRIRPELQPRWVARSSPARGRPFQRLTLREIEVGRLLVQGYACREIAATLGITYVTGRSHVQHIYDKLGCHSRVEAVLAFRQIYDPAGFDVVW